MSNKIMLFTDVSVHPKTKIGVGAYLMILEPKFVAWRESKNIVADKVKCKKFLDTSSTKLEIQTLLWALDELYIKNTKDQEYALTIYTDSQCIVSLDSRRERLEGNNYKSLGKNRVLNNAELYKGFFKYRDKINFELIKVKGHLKKKDRSDLDKLFALVDQVARKTLGAFHSLVR
ncbi:MAG: ribonuclease H [Bacteroidetes bacterium]|nr:ribonuclease H [Bacteroidota bacterium]